MGGGDPTGSITRNRLPSGVLSKQEISRVEQSTRISNSSFGVPISSVSPPARTGADISFVLFVKKISRSSALQRTKSAPFVDSCRLLRASGKAATHASWTPLASDKYPTQRPL